MRSSSLVLVVTSVIASALLAITASAESFEELDPTGWLGRARIGVQVQPMTPELREFFEVPRDRGVLVVRVVDDSPAAKVGILVGDVITEAAGEPIARPFQLVHRVATADRDEAFELELVRKGDVVSVSPKPEGQALPWPGNRDWHELGEQWRRGLEEGAHGLRERLEDFERRLEELERDRRLRETSGAEQRT